MPEELTDLSFCTTDEIFAELSKRHRSVIVVAEKLADKIGDNSEFELYYAGSFMAALGLLSWAKSWMLKKRK